VSSAVVGYVGAIIIVAILIVIIILDLPFLMHTVMVSVSKFKNAMPSENHTNVRNQKNYKNDAQEVVYV
jgi:Sec-independent protein translocase protein TatA